MRADRERPKAVLLGCAKKGNIRERGATRRVCLGVNLFVQLAAVSVRDRWRDKAS